MVVADSVTLSVRGANQLLMEMITGKYKRPRMENHAQSSELSPKDVPKTVEGDAEINISWS